MNRPPLRPVRWQRHRPDHMLKIRKTPRGNSNYHRQLKNILQVIGQTGKLAGTSTKHQFFGRHVFLPTVIQRSFQFPGNLRQHSPCKALLIREALKSPWSSRVTAASSIICLASCRLIPKFSEIYPVKISPPAGRRRLNLIKPSLTKEQLRSFRTDIHDSRAILLCSAE